MTQVIGATAAQCNLSIGQTHVGIKQHDAVTHGLQRNSQVHRDRGFTHSSFATGDANDLRRFCFIHEVHSEAFQATN